MIPVCLCVYLYKRFIPFGYGNNFHTLDEAHAIFIMKKNYHSNCWKLYFWNFFIHVTLNNKQLEKYAREFLCQSVYPTSTYVNNFSVYKNIILFLILQKLSFATIFDILRVWHQPYFMPETQLIETYFLRLLSVHYL